MQREMDSFVPPLLRDETVYSWIARWGILSGYPSHRSAVRVLLDSDSKQLASSFPSFLPKTHHYSRCTLGDLVEKHTVLPFFKPFITDDNYRMAKFALLSGKTEFLHSRLSLVANRVSMSEPLLYCPICSQYDYDELGYTYWRITHQLPGAGVCLRHRKYLKRIQVNRRELVLPPLDGCKHEQSDIVSPKQFLWNHLINDSFHNSDCNIDSSRLVQVYMFMLKNRDLANSSNKIRMEKFRLELNQNWKELNNDLVFDILKTNPSNTNSCPYPAPLFYQKHCQHHPLKHLLIIGFLFNSWDEFWAKVAEKNSPIECLAAPKAPVELVGSKSGISDETVIIQSLKKNESMRSIALRMNRSIVYVKKLAHLNDVKTESRAQKLFQTERDVAIELAKQGHSSSNIASELGCCVGAVEQILSQTSGLIEDRKRIRFISNRDKHRAIILKLVKTHSRRTDIQNTARSSYTFLFKHDKKWLNECLPSAIARTERYKG
jgi:predicted transcriptional regulator